MKILIICDTIGKSAPGIVFEKLIKGLSKHHEIDLIIPESNNSISDLKINSITSIKKMKVSSKITKVLMMGLNVNPFDILWGHNAFRSLNKKKDYDIVFGFISFGHYTGLVSGSYISKKLKKKFAVYSVDAIPAPESWMPIDIYYKALTKMMKKYLFKVDAFFSSNKQMLSYQLEKTSLDKSSIFKSIIYTAGSEEFQKYPLPTSKTNIFLYTGGMYGARKPDFVLKAFSKLLQKFPDSKLQFIGTVLPKKVFENFEREVTERIEVLPFTDNLADYYYNATALLDIDSDVENDIFLSSKIMNYLMVNRIIISQTGKNSPSRNLFGKLDSVFQCYPNEDQLFHAMEKAILEKAIIDFSDRREVIQIFKLENIIFNLNKDLSKIIYYNEI